MYNLYMSKQKTILLSLLILVLVLVLGFYVYQKNNSGPKPLTKEEIEAQQRADLMRYELDPTKQKTEMEQKAELELFAKPSTSSKLTEEEMRNILTSEEVGS